MSLLHSHSQELIEAGTDINLEDRNRLTLVGWAVWYQKHGTHIPDVSLVQKGVLGGD